MTAFALRLGREEPAIADVARVVLVTRGDHVEAFLVGAGADDDALAEVVHARERGPLFARDLRASCFFWRKRT